MAGRSSGNSREAAKDKLRNIRAFYYTANPRLYMNWLLNRYCWRVIQDAVIEHFVNEGKNAVGNGGNMAPPWAGKTDRNIKIRIQRHVSVSLPVLVNSGLLRKYVSNSVVVEYSPSSSTVYVSLYPQGRPPYANAHHTGAFIKNSPYGPIHLAKRPLVRFTVGGYNRVLLQIQRVLSSHFNGDLSTPGPRG